MNENENMEWKYLHVKAMKRWPVWPLVWLVQLVSMLALSVGASLSLYLGGAIHGAVLWGLMPAAGLVSALLATLKGLLNYAAWIAPPAMLFLGYWLTWSYAPPTGPVLLCALISLVGAAAGEVLKRQRKSNKGVRSWKKI